MKHITLLAFALAAFVPASAQVVFSSGVEDWSGGLPDDFMGSKTNLPVDSISIEGAMQHSGDFAVRLQNANSSHRRFTTQPVAVTAGTSYTIEFWVRGMGQIRTGLFDGRATGSGYATYNSYVNTTTTWTLVTQTIVCEHDTTDGEFIFSVRNDPVSLEGDILIDDVNISVSTTGPTSATIPDIQTTAAPDGSSPLANTQVITSGIVTAVGGGGYFLQDGTGPWTGLFVNDATNTPGLGDEVSVTGTVQENFGLTRLNAIIAYQVVSSGNPIPAASVISTATANTEPYESVLVKVMSATCTDPAPGFGQWVINDGSGPVFCDDMLFPYVPVLNGVYNVTGPLFYSFSEWKILPREALDIEIVTAVPTLTAGAALRVWPVPAVNELFVEQTAGNTELELLDATGRTVWATRSADLLERIDVSAFPAGLYSLMARQQDVRTATRIIITH